MLRFCSTECIMGSAVPRHHHRRAHRIVPNLSSLLAMADLLEVCDAVKVR